MLVKRLEDIMVLHGIASWEAVDQFFVEHPDLLAQFIESNMPHETQFFRVQPQFRYLQRHILPAWKASAGKIRIWSAATSNGAEAYSAAILLREAGIGPHEARIVATDMDADILKQAKAGVYTKKHVQNIRPDWLNRYFEQVQGGKFRITGDIRAYVDFRVHNLVQTPWPWPANRFDLIFLEHVLIYFAPRTIADVLLRVEKVLKPDGYLFTSYSEPIPTSLRHRWQTTIVENVIFHRLLPEPRAEKAPVDRPAAPSRSASRPRETTLSRRPKRTIAPQIVTGPEQKKHPTFALAQQQSSRQEQPDLNTLAWRYYEEGKRALDERRFEEAIQALDKALYINSHLTEAALVKAGILKRQGKNAEALRTYQWVLKRLVAKQQPDFGTLEQETIAAICRHSIRQLAGTQPETLSLRPGAAKS